MVDGETLETVRVDEVAQLAGQARFTDGPPLAMGIGGHLLASLRLAEGRGIVEQAVSIVLDRRGGGQ